MASTPQSTVGSRERRVAALADELRADAANGLYYDGVDPDPDAAAPLARLRHLTARLLAEVDTRSTGELEAVFDTDNRLRTPHLGVVLILNDQRRGLLLAKDPDTGRLGAPHAFVAAELEPEAAVRGLAARFIPDSQVMPVPHGICDSISAGLPIPHTYYLTFVVDVTFVAPESIQGELVPAAEVDESGLDALTVYIMGGADRTVIEAPLALPDSTRRILGDIHDLAVAGKAATENPYNLARFGRVADTMSALLEGVDSQVPLTRGRIEDLDARSRHTGAEALILDGQGRVLLMRRSDTRTWAMPGGACEVGESSAATAVREAMEEVCLEVEIDGLAGVYDSRTLTPSFTGDFVIFVYVARLKNPGDEPQSTVEALEAAWYHPEEMDALDMFGGHEIKIARALQVLKG